MSADSVEEFVPEQDDEAPYTAVIAPPPPRTVLMGSAMAFVVMSFTTLAVAVAVNIRPVADSEAQPVPAIQSQTVPGNYLPDVPHAPDPVALPVAVVSPQSADTARPRIVQTNQGPAIKNAPVVPPGVQPGQPIPLPEVPPVPLPPDVIPPWNPFPLPTLPTLPTFPWPTYTHVADQHVPTRRPLRLRHPPQRRPRPRPHSTSTPSPRRRTRARAGTDSCAEPRTQPDRTGACAGHVQPAEARPEPRWRRRRSRCAGRACASARRAGRPRLSHPSRPSLRLPLSLRLHLSRPWCLSRLRSWRPRPRRHP